MGNVNQKKDIDNEDSDRIERLNTEIVKLENEIYIKINKLRLLQETYNQLKKKIMKLQLENATLKHSLEELQLKYNSLHAISREYQEELNYLVKSANIHVHDKKLYMIDFGWTKSTDPSKYDIFILKDRDFLENCNSYRYWPEDIGISFLLWKYRRSSEAFQLAIVVDSFRSNEQIIELNKLSGEAFIDYKEKYLQNSVEKFDVYSLGITMREDLWFDCRSSVIQTNILFEKLVPELNITNEVKDIIMNMLADLINSMCDKNPITRISIDDLVIGYNNFINYIKSVALPAPPPLDTSPPSPTS